MVPPCVIAIANDLAKGLSIYKTHNVSRAESEAPNDKKK